MAVLLETSVGDVVVDLMLEERPKGICIHHYDCALDFLVTTFEIWNILRTKEAKLPSSTQIKGNRNSYEVQFSLSPWCDLFTPSTSSLCFAKPSLFSFTWWCPMGESLWDCPQEDVWPEAVWVGVFEIQCTTISAIMYMYTFFVLKSQLLGWSCSSLSDNRTELQCQQQSPARFYDECVIPGDRKILCCREKNYIALHYKIHCYYLLTPHMHALMANNTWDRQRIDWRLYLHFRRQTTFVGKSQDYLLQNSKAKH